MHIQVDTRGCVLFTLDVCRLLSLEESDMCTDTQSHLLRLLIPALKLYTAKKVCTASSHIKNCVALVSTYYRTIKKQFTSSLWVCLSILERMPTKTNDVWVEYKMVTKQHIVVYHTLDYALTSLNNIEVWHSIGFDYGYIRWNIKRHCKYL